MTKRLKRWFIRLLLPLSVLYLRLLSRTVRWERRYDFEKDRGKIYALWHGNALCMALMGIDRGIYTLVSRFRDGDVAEYILKGLGYGVVRGSTEEGRAEKGGRVGVLKLLQVLKEGHNVAITVDGPKGPAFEVKSGVVFLAQKSGCPIVPAYAHFERSIRLNTWDLFTIPLPFSRARLVVGREIKVGPEDSLEEKVKELQEELSRVSSSGIPYPPSWELSQNSDCPKRR